MGGTKKSSAVFENVQLAPYASTQLKDADVDRMAKDPSLSVTMRNGKRINVVISSIAVNADGLVMTVHNVGSGSVRFNLEIG